LLEGFFLARQHFACIVEDDIALADTALRRLGVCSGSRNGERADSE
jgi:GR25 family glycosyltransferase involved in LPS biosynthesis